MLTPDEIQRLRDIDKNHRLFDLKLFAPVDSESTVWDEEQDEAYKL